MNETVEELIGAEDWAAARRAIRRELRSSPDDHWLLTRLGTTYYEQKRYRQALKYSDKALALEPTCPLALWDRACALQMLNQPAAALQTYRHLVRRGVRRLASGQCGEGGRWACGLVADCHYRMAGCYRQMGKRRLAVRALKQHLSLRGPACWSIYSLRAVRKELKSLEKELGNT